MDFNYMASILDEVALEGLDGITLPMLWLRLENRPNFPIRIDDDSKAFIWRSIALHCEVQIFKLPHPRPLVPLYNRYEHVDDLGLVLEPPENFHDIYSVEMIKDGDIRGSCSTYHSRKNITARIRDDDALTMSLQEVLNKWDDKLVLVASPRTRLISLIGPEANPLTMMSSEEYCLLERVGRSRYHGEVTQGRAGLLSSKAPFSKQLHYYRKKLTLKGFVTKQRHFSRNPRGIAVCGSLFHLVRFYMLKKSKMEILILTMCDILKDKPKNMETCRKIREELNITESTFKKLFHRNVEKFLRIVTVRASEFKAEPSTSTDISERLVKAVKLIKNCNVDNLDDITNDDKEDTQALNVYLDISKIYQGLPLIMQIYRLIQEAGSEGITAAVLGKETTLPKLDIRNILRTLLKQNRLETVLVERGRQKETIYIATNFVDQNEDFANVGQKDKTDIKNEQVSFSEKRKNNTCADAPTKKIRCDAGKPTASRVKENEPIKSNENLSILDSENSGAIEFKNIEVEMSELQSYEEFSGKPPTLMNLNESSNQAVSLLKIQRLTYRKFKRMNMILEHIKVCGFTCVSDLQKHLREREQEEGYKFQVDKRSTSRLLHRLFLDKKLKIYKAVLKLGAQKTEIEFISDNSLNQDDPIFQPAIEQAKFKLYSAVKDSNAAPNHDISSLGDDDDDDNDNDVKKEVCPKSEPRNPSSHDRKMIQDLQIHPKFMRFKTFHKFLYYLVYGYEGHSKNQPSDHSPLVYHDSMTWKRFIPPLPTKERKEGWCFLADIYNRLPLCIIVKSVNMRHRINEFADYLVDSEKCNYLITSLPKKMLRVLLYRRKYIFSIDEVIKNLCYMGLVSYGPQTAKKKDNIHLYIHKLVTFKNTSCSTPGYLHINPNIAYEKKTFSFDSLADVEKYWMELEQVCSSTPLGKFSAVVGKTYAVVECRHKPELVEASRHKSFEEVLDIGQTPGDGLGAGGLDSSLFSHQRRNWQSVGHKECEKTTKPVSNPVSSISMQALLKHNRKLGPECSRLQRLSRLRLAAQKDKSLNENFPQKTKNNGSIEKNVPKKPITSKPSRSKSKIKIRTVKERKKRERAPYMDEKDKAAMEKMALYRTRADWSAQEDSFLLLCKVASSFLDPSIKAVVVPFTVIRDLLHEHCPDEGTTKTSRACQRRIRYMLLNPTTMNNVAVFLGEAKQDTQLVKDFEKYKPSKSNEEAWAELFTAVLNRLLVMFTMPASDRCKNFSLPKTRESFEKLFTVLPSRAEFHRKNPHKDPHDENEIKSCVLYSLILSTMALENDGTIWSYLLYKLYHVYPEYVLRSVVSRLRSEKVIACKKRKCKRDFEPSLMATFPYRLSITYENTLLTKFPIRLFVQSKELLEKCKDTKKEVITLKDCIPPGYTFAAMALSMLNEITLSLKVPEHIILFDSGLSKEARSSIVKRMAHSLSDKESHELARMLSNNKGQARHVSTHEDHTVNERQTPSELGNKTEVQRSTNASRFALYLLRQELSQPPIEKVQHSQDFIVLNSCDVLCHLKSSGERSDSYFDSEEESPLQSNQQEVRGKILTDGCISEIKDSLGVFIPPGAFDQYENYDEPLEMIYDAYSSQTLNNAKCIFGEIFNAGSIGISEERLWRKYRSLTGELSLFEHLHLFREAMLVVRAGVSTFLYVCISFAKVWTLQSYLLPEASCKKENEDALYKSSETLDSNNTQLPNKILDSSEKMDCSEPTNLGGSASSSVNNPTGYLDTAPQFSVSDLPAIAFSEEVYFLPRIWRRPDGSVNKKALLLHLQTILSHIIHSPGVGTSHVIERFSPIMQPIQILELLEILEKGCCITKYYCKKNKQGTLFSSFNPAVITKNPDPDDMDHLETLPDSLCNLVKIQEALL